MPVSREVLRGKGFILCNVKTVQHVSLSGNGNSKPADYGFIYKLYLIPLANKLRWRLTESEIEMQIRGAGLGMKGASSKDSLNHKRG